MKLRLMGRTMSVGAPVLYGSILVVIGVVLLALAYSAQAKMDDIGATTDPALLEEISNLEDQREVFLLFGLAAIFVGMFAAVVIVEKSLPAALSGSQMISSARAGGDTLMGLSLTGNAAFLPAKHGLTKERILVPAPRNGMIPPSAVSDDLVVSPGRDGSTPGILMEPLGRSLLDAVEADLGVKFSGANVEVVEGNLQYLKHGLGIMRDFHFKERDGKTVMRVEYSGLVEACRQVRKELPDTCRQFPCVGCSALLTAAARGTGKIVRIEEVDNKEDNVVFTLSLNEW
ncbi:MAG TPA: hypothetical protein VJ489_01060 [Thermoplasmata archaeon]|nr:hypothetical protein [Thermoplasmata archaeon]